MSPEYIFMINKQNIINICDKVIEVCFYALMVSVTFSTSFVEIFSSLMIIAWIVKKVIEKDISWMKLGPVKIIFVYLFWVILSCVNSQYFSESFRGIFKAVEYMALFIIMAATPWKKEVLKRFLYVMIGAAIFVCGNGFFQYFTGEGLVRHRTLIPLDHLRRISSSFVHPNDFGVYLLVITIIFMAFILSNTRKFRSKLTLAVPFIITAISLFLTRSRGAWLSFSASFLVLGAAKTTKMVAVFLTLLLVIFVMLPYTVQERIFDLTDFQSGTTWERIMLWKGTINMIKEHPILGFGVNTYSRNFPKYKPGEYPDVRYSHNCYLHMASEIGIVGALIFLLFLVSVFVSVWKKFSVMMPGNRKDLCIGLFAGLIGFAFNSIVDTHLYSVNLAVFFHLLLGFCFSLSYYDENK